MIPNKVVDNAIFRVANNGWRWFESKSFSVLLMVFSVVCFPSYSSSDLTPYSPRPRRLSTVKLDCTLLRSAILWITTTASASFPLPMRYFGDSYKVKAKNLIAHSASKNPPMTKKKYRHPWFDERGHEPPATQEKFPRRGHAIWNVGYLSCLCKIIYMDPQGSRSVGRKPTRRWGLWANFGVYEERTLQL